eukprot:Lankesteria_metandrocarpae@DN3871_c0_g2_i1.p1
MLVTLFILFVVLVGELGGHVEAPAVDHRDSLRKLGVCVKPPCPLRSGPLRSSSRRCSGRHGNGCAGGVGLPVHSVRSQPLSSVASDVNVFNTYNADVDWVGLWKEGVEVLAAGNKPDATFLLYQFACDGLQQSDIMVELIVYKVEFLPTNQELILGLKDLQTQHACDIGIVCAHGKEMGRSKENIMGLVGRDGVYAWFEEGNVSGLRPCSQRSWWSWLCLSAHD